ncbi:MAG: lytic transglycosylase domain-containing protein [Sterolibacterium sp.]|nr:lytic transglycosylase domain-containing protein [Sterolibacterium sp.]
MLPGLELLVAQCAPLVAPVTMLAIVRVESGGNPLAMNVNGKQRLARQPASLVEALAWSDWLMARGYSVDLGLAQVNSRHLKRFGLPASMLFDPCTNIAVGARILMENYAQASHKYADSQDALRAAISAYNTGNHTAGLSNGYVRKVATAAGRVAAQPGMAAMPLLVNR